VWSKAACCAKIVSVAPGRGRDAAVPQAACHVWATSATRGEALLGRPSTCSSQAAASGTVLVPLKKRACCASFTLLLHPVLRYPPPTSNWCLCYAAAAAAAAAAFTACRVSVLTSLHLHLPALFAPTIYPSLLLLRPERCLTLPSSFSSRHFTSVPLNLITLLTQVS
jgi:hypothetical protein